MAGDSEWRIGVPITPAARVCPVITRYPQPSPASRQRSLAARNSLLLSVKKWFPSASSST